MEFHSRIPGTLSGIAEKTIKITLHIWYMAKAYTRNELNDLGTYPCRVPMKIDINLIETLTPKNILYSTLLNEGGGETYLVYFFSEKLIGGRYSYEKIIRFYFL